MKITDWVPLGIFLITLIGGIWSIVTVVRNGIKKDIKAELNLDKIDRLEQEVKDLKALNAELNRKLDEKNAAIMRLK